MLNAKQLSSSKGFVASRAANPFAGLDTKRPSPQQQQSASQAGKRKGAASAVAEPTAAEVEAAAERKRQKNREKRLRKKKAAAAAAGGKPANDSESDGEEEEEEEQQAPAQTDAAAAAAAPGSGADSEEEEEEQVAASASVSESDEEEEEAEEEEDEQSESESESEAEAAVSESASASASGGEESEEEEEEAAEESEEEESEEEDGSSEEESEAEADGASVAAQVVNLGHDASLVAVARSQLEASGLPVNVELLLLAVQQEEALANERRTGKHTVFKPKPAAKPAPAPAPKQTPAAPKQQPAAASAKQPAATKPTAPASSVAAKPALAAQAAKSKAAAPSATTAAASAPAASAAPSSSSSVAAATIAPAAAAAAPAPSVPRDDHSVAGLERSAARWDPVGDVSALTLVDEWSALLERASGSTLSAAALRSFVAPPEAASFALSFHQSQALELLVRTLLTRVFVSAVPVATQRAVDASLLRLLVQSVSGRRPVDQRFLLDSLRSLARSLEKASVAARGPLVDQILKVVTASKRLAGVHRQIDAALNHEARTNAQPPSAKEIEAAAMAELAKLAATTTHAGVANPSNDSVRRLWLSSFASGARVQAGEASLQQFHAVLAANPQSALQLNFHLLEKEVQSSIALSLRAVEQHASQSGVVSQQRASLDLNRERELQVHLQAGREHGAREAELLKRKAELLNELDRVNKSLDTVALARERQQAAVNAIEEQHRRNSASLQSMHASTLALGSALQQDAAAAHAIHGLIVGSYSRLAACNGARLQSLSQANGAATARHLSHAAAHLSHQHALVDFLQQRAAFCSGKLQTLAAERAEAQRLGVPLASQQEESQMRALVRDDTNVASSARNQANALLARLVKAARSDTDTAPHQLHQLYAQLLRDLLAAKVTAFDLQALRELVAQLQARAQGQDVEVTTTSPPVAQMASPASPALAVTATTSPAPIAGADVAAAADPFAQGLPPRKSFKERQREKELARQQQKQAQAQAQGQGQSDAAAQAQPQSGASNGRNGHANRIRTKANANGASSNGSSAAPPAAAAAAGSAAPSASARPAGAAPRSWGAAAAAATPSPPPSGAASSASSSSGGDFPQLSASLLQQVKKEERQAVKARAVHMPAAGPPAARPNAASSASSSSSSNAAEEKQD